jgi:soluble lytic murein transglycosylase-like protein
MRAMRIFVFVLLALVPLTEAQAEIYTYTDSRGVSHFSNVPDNKQYRLIVATQSVGGGSAMGTTSDRPAQVASVADRKRFAPLVEEAARDYQVDSALLHAVITAESGYNPNAISKKGAAGLMQLMPDTAKRYGVGNSFDPAQNVRGGAQYLRDLLKMFDNNLELAVAAYNAGEKAVMNNGNRIPPYRETLAYVPKVMKLHKKYQSIL